MLDERLAAIGRLRERVRRWESLREQPGGPDEGELVDVRAGLAQLSRDDTGRVVHGELLPRKRLVPPMRDGVIWMHRTSAEHGLASPAALGAATHCMAVMVDDVDAHYARAAEAGADVVGEPSDQPYGYREYDARDLEGGLWSFMSPLEGAPDE